MRLTFIILFPLSLLNAQADFTSLVYPAKVSIDFQRIESLSMSQLKEIAPNIELPDSGMGFFFARFQTLSGELAKQVNREDLARDLKFFDFSGDGVADLIFCGNAGPEEHFTYLWQRVRQTYLKRGGMWGRPTRLIRNAQVGPYSFVVLSGLCCAGYVGEYRLYSPSNQSRRLSYVARDTVLDFHEMVFPNKRTLSIDLLVKKPTQMLRLSPMILDTLDELASSIEEMPVRGNILSHIPGGSQVLAIARAVDEANRKWMFVLFRPKAKLAYSRFYSSPMATIAGWMEEKSLKTIK